MRITYQALRAHAGNMLLQDGATDPPTPPYYDYRHSIAPHPFMGLAKFVVGTIHQMRAAKSYFAPQTS